MKKLFFLLIAVLTAAILLVSCDTPADSSTVPDSSTTPVSSSASESSQAPESSTAPDSSGEQGGDDKPEVKTITIAEALALCGEEGFISTERYLIRATVEAVTNPAYGQMIVKDETGSIEVYGSYSADGEKRYSEMTEKPYKGYTVLLSCILQNYNGTKEVKSAWILEFEEGKVDTDTSSYTDMTALEARAAADGTKIKIDGVVARITYANGMIPSGFYLVDNTNSIYVYDRDAAGRVKIGDTVTVAASKTYWILESELQSAQKFGYEGCCQLEDVIDVKIEDTKADFDKSWIESSTVKAIMETPLSTNITTTIFKVNALVSKVDGNGFINYYINDIDGKTGSYTYTQCSGGDFSWLDEFDGKICTVYLSVINAKASSSGCVYRFLPIAVSYDNYTFDVNTAPTFALQYYALEQFKSEYTGDPVLEVLTTLSSELLGFNGLTLTYTSSNSAIVNFANEDGKTVMHCLANGTVTVTVTAALNGKSESKTLEIKVTKPDTIASITVKEAIAATVGDTVTVKGIVGPSLVNQTGFYLFNDDAMIAIRTTTDVMDSIEIGQEIIIEGKRDLFNKADKGSNEFGQTCITNAVVKANNYGKHEYSTDFFITNKTLADLYALDVTVDHSTEVYVVKATVKWEETAYYTKMSLEDGDTTFTLYCSSAKQYGFLKAYAGQEVTLEIAPCNWNDKNFWAGCALAVYTPDGKVLNTLNFDSN